jgi:NTP pyrophosphatase (non-canonical NTP hydrolase)
MDDFSPLTIESYAAQALTTDQRSDSGSLTFPLLGLFGETGSLLSEVKKKQRDRASYVGYAGAVVEELGDVLWYLTVIGAWSERRRWASLVGLAAIRARGMFDNRDPISVNRRIRGD